MFWHKVFLKTFKTDLRYIATQGLNDSIRDLIKSVDPIEMVDNEGMTIFHLAAKYNNIELMKFLLECGYDINVKTRIGGATPLTMAIVCNNYEAIKYLLKNNANVLIFDTVSLSPLHLLIDKDNPIPWSVMECLAKRLTRCGLTTKEMIEVLAKVNGTLEFALRMDDPELTKEMLRTRREVCLWKAHMLLIIAMKYNYLNNVHVLLHYGDKAAYRREKFRMNLTERLLGTRLEVKSSRPFLKHLAQWDIVDDKFVINLQRIVEKCSAHVIEMMLEYYIDTYLRRKFRKEIQVYMYANCNESTPKLLYDPLRFNVNTRDNDGLSALHIAVMRLFSKRVKYLLEKGANPNIKDKYGQNPLILAWDVNSIKYLLDAGADIQIVDNNHRTVFSKSDHLWDYNEILLAHLAIIDGRGVTIKRKVYDRVYSINQFKEFYNKRQLEVDWMKRIVVNGIITLFTVLTKKPEDLAWYIRDRDTVDKLLDCIRNRQLYSFYASKLEINLNKALNIVYELRYIASCDD